MSWTGCVGAPPDLGRDLRSLVAKLRGRQRHGQFIVSFERLYRIINASLPVVQSSLTGGPGALPIVEGDEPLSESS